MEKRKLPLFAPEEPKCKIQQVKLCQKHSVSFFNEKIGLLLLPHPFWWAMRRWVTPLFSSPDSATKQTHLTAPLLGGLVSKRDLWTTVLRVDSSSHMIERSEVRGSGHLNGHPLYGEGSPVVSGSVSCPVWCHVQPCHYALASSLPAVESLQLLYPFPCYSDCRPSSLLAHKLPCRTDYLHPFIAFKKNCLKIFIR